MTRSPSEQLVKYLADAHSVEEQALAQLRAAPRIAAEGRLSRAFREHLAETERHERLVRERLEAHGADPSRLKDAAGKAGGYGMVLFALVNPDTPGKLTAHAYSYEHMELATYELLRRAAEEAGDEETAAVAADIGEDERDMGERLAGSFDAAVEASLKGVGREEIDKHVNNYLADAHALEKQAIRMLSSAPKVVRDEGLASFLREHLEQTKEHERLVAARLEARGAKSSKLKDIALSAGGLNLSGFFGAQPDTTAKLAGFAYAFEHLEIAAYELLKRVAVAAGDPDTEQLAERILAEERAAAADIATTWDRAMRAEMAARTS
jgi:ferritin-like metal-binding protein YciE